MLVAGLAGVIWPVVVVGVVQWCAIASVLNLCWKLGGRQREPDSHLVRDPYVADPNVVSWSPSMGCRRLIVESELGARGPSDDQRRSASQGPSRRRASSMSDLGPANDNRTYAPPLTVSKSTPGAIATPVSANSFAQNASESVE